MQGEMHKLEYDLARFNYDKCCNSSKPKLFLWNSWANSGNLLRQACFGGQESDVLGIEWLNMLELDTHEDGETIFVVAPSYAGLGYGV